MLNDLVPNASKMAEERVDSNTNPTLFANTLIVVQTATNESRMPNIADILISCPMLSQREEIAG